MPMETNKYSSDMPDRSHEMSSLEPAPRAERRMRRRLTRKQEFILAIFPTIIVLIVFGLVQILSSQRLLFASLASSAFLIYLDPKHGTNSVRTLVLAQMSAAIIGLCTYLVIGPGYLSGGTAMIAVIILMILADAVHPPAVSTALSFALRSGDESNVILFGLAVGITAMLVILETTTLWLLARMGGHD